MYDTENEAESRPWVAGYVKTDPAPEQFKRIWICCLALQNISSVHENKMQFDKNSNSLPKRAEHPEISGAPGGAAWFWGKDDEVSLLKWGHTESGVSSIITHGVNYSLVV